MTDSERQQPRNRWAFGDGRVGPEVAAAYRAAGWWGTDTLAQVVARHAAARPGDPAYIVITGEGERTLTWRDYDRRSAQLADVLVGAGFAPGDRVALLLPDGPEVHVAMVAAEKAGLVTVGIGHRAGDAEIRHLVRRTGATGIVTHDERAGRDSSELVKDLRSGTAPDLRHVVVPQGPFDAAVVLDGAPAGVPPPSSAGEASAGRALGSDDIFTFNSTSGTTGLPKCVVHTQNRWFHFHRLAVESGRLAGDDVFFGAVPAPFGFGLWTAHFTPAILGAPTIVGPRFDADATLQAIARHRVTVIACVSTQFIMMLNSPLLAELDLTSLRAMYTGGEAVPYERAAAFEDRTGAAVLQFYGSNETGALSRTTLADGRDRRLRTAGRVIDEMQVRVYDEAGGEVHGAVRRGIPAAKGPLTCLGYLDDDAANDQLLTEDRWMLMGDIVEIDEVGYLQVVGRTSDIIIRGGKNISAPAVEAEVLEHPAVAMAAAVAMPDQIFGERVCVYVVPVAGAGVTLDDLVRFLLDRGMSKEWLPERLEVVDDLPRSSGGKVAKGQLREDIRRRLAGAVDAGGN